jgi:hypothetical protein
MMRLLGILLASTLSLRLGIAQDQPAPKPKETRPQGQEERIRKLEEEVQALKAGQSAPPAEPSRLGGAGASAAKALNPDISLNGDFRASIGSNAVRPVPGLEMHELELGLQSVIDPYARGDVFLAFGAEGVEVEEAFLTWSALPGQVVAKVGKLRADFGKVNLAHNHTLAWTDRPLVMENLVNGEEGIGDMGVSLSRILPAPGTFFLEATAQVFRGDSGDLFTASRNSDLSFVGRLRGYQDLSDNTNLEIGYSHARGHNELGHEFLTRLHGLDVSLRWKPLVQSNYNAFLWRTEFVWSRRDQLPRQERAFGWYSSLDYRLNRRWTVGARFDSSERATLASQRDRGVSALLTYWMSEFSQLRGQYRSTRYDGGQDTRELRLQLAFLMGAHGAHAF